MKASLKKLGRSVTICVLAIACLAVVTPTPAQAQLNENCVISILNRTAQVQPDGSWFIANVPSNFGGVCARATAHEVAHLFGPDHNIVQSSLMFAPDEQTQSQSPNFGTVFLDDEIDEIRKFGLGQTP